ncbi:histidine phosphatase family protein [Desulfopila aestuarii]|uniref:Alpha-ribazole phosphatase n=1 Tax=Desulfopila aestuarii DSM 18488 TaxID=1121416 RepID=A0A1M7YC91_9BACT|nr:histidine phosphatase family protein [Desulfopila aestuarii]SHO50128.1 alpha-ribazole phosphatase [Desulfopila aestuarii DSM 18488]
MAKTLYLLRHGETAANGRLVGSTDMAVAEHGYVQLAQTGERLRRRDISAVFCSPMLRCRQSAEFLQLSLDPVIVDDLREMDFGDWENKSFSEIAELWPSEVAAWSNWSEQFTFPGGENIGNFLCRLQKVQECILQCEAEKILLVTHGGVIRHLLCLYLNLSPANYLLFDIRPGRYSTLSLHSQGGVLTSLNS